MPLSVTEYKAVLMNLKLYAENSSKSKYMFLGGLLCSPEVKTLLFQGKG